MMAIPQLRKQATDIPKLRQTNALARSTHGEVISTQLSSDTGLSQEEEVRILMRYYDYMFTDEGSLLANWGIENKTFVYGDDGKPTFTDLIMNNPDGLSFLGANAVYLGGRNQAGY